MHLTIEKFKGSVVLKQATPWMDGRSYWGFTGTVSVLEGKDALGFEVKDDSNWFARIESPDGEGSINVPGCQVRAVVQGEYDAPANNGFLTVPNTAAVAF